MMIPLIEIDSKKEELGPSMRLSQTSPGSVWQYMGSCLTSLGDPNQQASKQDLNRAAEAAAQALQKKVSSRNIDVELVIDPLIPPISVENGALVPILASLAENASASVEPGPGTVTLCTWWNDKFAGVDALGKNGQIPCVIRENLARPGFSTRVAEWDTGFGLHAAMEAAAAIAGRIEFFEPEGAIGFRLALPIKQGTPLSPAEARVGVPGADSPSDGALSKKYDQVSFELLTSLKGSQNVDSGIIQA